MERVVSAAVFVALSVLWDCEDTLLLMASPRQRSAKDLSVAPGCMPPPQTCTSNPPPSTRDAAAFSFPPRSSSIRRSLPLAGASGDSLPNPNVASCAHRSHFCGPGCFAPQVELRSFPGLAPRTPGGPRPDRLPPSLAPHQESLPAGLTRPPVRRFRSLPATSASTIMPLRFSLHTCPL